MSKTNADVTAARNVFLLTLIRDDLTDISHDDVWSLYYHFHITDRQRDILRSHAQRLLGEATSIGTWRNGRYGRWIRFCTEASLQSVRQMWTCYAASGQDAQRAERNFLRMMNNARKMREYRVTNTAVMTAFRSAAPLGVRALEQSPRLHEHFWKHGTTGENSGPSKADKVNLMFSSTTSTMHYGTDPILGFHLALAFAPLADGTRYSNNDALVLAAKAEFSAWCDGFRQSVQSQCQLRFFVGDALALCLAFQARLSHLSPITLSQYESNWDFRPLRLDDTDDGFSLPGPVTFDVIDTSNLTDHLGLLHVLLCAQPLLKKHVSSTLYTEILIDQGQELSQSLEAGLCGPISVVTTLLGLFPPEYWTNASMTAAIDEGVFENVRKLLAEVSSSSGQLRSRMAWKCMTTSWAGGPGLKFDEEDLSRTLYEMYLHMFPRENLKQTFAELTMRRLTISTPHYTRASFAALLQTVKSTVNCDWTRVMANLIDLIGADRHLIVGRNFMQELYTYLHLFDLYSVDTLQPGCEPFSPPSASNFIHEWNDRPPVVCVTIVVPRNKLDLISRMTLQELGTPRLCCSVESARWGTWHNMFATLQVGLGHVEARGSQGDDSFHVDFVLDKDGWLGRSDLVVSFLVPCWVLLLEPDDARVSLQLQSSPGITPKLLSLLGPGLTLFQTALGDRQHVFVTKNRPHQNHLRSPLPGPREPVNDASTQTDFHISAAVDLDESSKQLQALRYRVDVTSERGKSLLAARATIHLDQQDPMSFTIVLGQGGLACSIECPIPVSSKHGRLGVARSSAYIEVIAPAIERLGRHAAPAFMFPSSMMALTGDVKIPIRWNMPGVDMDRLPVLDTGRKKEMEWLVTHTSLMFSAREARIRGASVSSSGGTNRAQDNRVEFKDGLFSIFMHFSGQQGYRSRVFALYKENEGGVHVLIYVSALRLDPAQHSVVLDAALLPLTDELVEQESVGPVLASSNFQEKMCLVKVSNEELRLWKHNLPAFTERCRTWSHNPQTCEYRRENRIPPISGLEDGQSPLCSCGLGQLPPDLLRGWKTPHLGQILGKFATRAAISPCFAVPYVEDCFHRDFGPVDKQVALTGKPDAPSKSSCRACGTPETEQTLLVCSRCRSVKYCSKECQRRDWKAHKQSCLSS